MDSVCRMALVKSDAILYFGIILILCTTGSHCKIIGTNKDKLVNNEEATYDGNSPTSMGNLSRRLFESYDNSIRPYCPGYEQTNMTIDMAIRQLIELDEPNQVVRFNIWMRLSWKDCHLKWNPEDYDGITDITIPYARIWTPDISLFERISEEFYGLEHFRPTIYHDGTVDYNFPSTIEALCSIDVTKFPFDTQICDLTFTSWAYHGVYLNITSKSFAADLSSLKPNVEFIIEKAPAQRNVMHYATSPNPYVDITFHVYMKRKPMYYINNIIIPAILITFIAAFGFILPVDSGEKIGLELTVMLAMSVFQLLVADKLPPSSDSTPWIGIYFTFTLFLSGFASFIQILVLNIHHREDVKMSRCVKFCILQPLATLTFIDVPGITTNRCISDKNVFYVKEKDSTPEDNILWKLLAKCLDRFGLILFLLMFSIGTAVIFVLMLDETYV